MTNTEIERYDRLGAVTIDTPLTVDELDQAEAAWDRHQTNDHPWYEEPAFVDAVQHPFFEAVSKQVLRTAQAQLSWGILPHRRAPAEAPYDPPAKQWCDASHIDFQSTIEDFEATPRRVRLEFWLWLNDVPAHRGAMRVCEGSHRPIMEHWSRVVTPAHKKMLPRVRGMKAAPRERNWTYPEYVPDLDGRQWLQETPTPMVARRGQVLVAYSGALHSAWQNEDDIPRKALLITWGAAGVRCGFPRNQIDDMMKQLPVLRARLLPERQHIVPPDFDWVFESNFDTRWPETFLPESGSL